MFRCLEHTTNEDALEKPGGFRSFMDDLIAAFNHLKMTTEKTESNFSQRCTEKGNYKEKSQLGTRWGGGKNHKVCC